MSVKINSPIYTCVFDTCWGCYVFFQIQRMCRRLPPSQPVENDGILVALIYCTRRHALIYYHALCCDSSQLSIVMLFEFFSNLSVIGVASLVHKLICCLQTIKMDILVSASRTACVLPQLDNVYFFPKPCIKCSIWSTASKCIPLSFTVLSVWKIRCV